MEHERRLWTGNIFTQISTWSTHPQFWAPFNDLAHKKNCKKYHKEWNKNLNMVSFHPHLCFLFSASLDALVSYFLLSDYGKSSGHPIAHTVIQIQILQELLLSHTNIDQRHAHCYFFLFPFTWRNGPFSPTRIWTLNSPLIKWMFYPLCYRTLWHLQYSMNTIDLGCGLSNGIRISFISSNKILT